MNLAASPLLLNYFFSTDPAPIQVSTAQTTTNARINTSVSPAGTGPVYCNKILLAYPTGADPDEVYAAAPSASLNTAAWAVTTQVVKGSDLGFVEAIADADYTTFIFQCNSAQYYLINYNLVFGALGAVNLSEGDFDILVQENSGTTSDPGTFTPKQGSFTLTKGLPQFYLNNFVATNPNAPTVPATDFTAASPIYFEWESNGTFYQIFQQNQTQPVYAGTATNFTLSAGLVRDTTFILVAMVSGNPSGDQGQGGFEPIFLYSPLTITISNPTLTPSSVTAGTLSVTGNSTLTGTLNVTGATTAGSVQASSLGVSGNSSLATATVSGTLGVTGQATTNGLTINGALSAMGLATFSAGIQGTGGPVALMNAAQAVNPGTYGANTDGFVIGFCSWPSNFSQLCLGSAYGSCGSASVRATGGSFCLLDSGGTKYWGYNANAFILPVNNGATWSVQSLQAPNNQATAPTAFWWVPVGTPASGAETFTRIGEAPMVEFPRLHQLPAKKPKPDYVPNLVEIIESISGKKLDHKHREALTEVLTKMNED